MSLIKKIDISESKLIEGILKQKLIHFIIDFL